MGYLGDTLPAIAREKAGILKPGVPCFLGRLPAEADDVVTEVARGVGAPMFRLGRDFRAPSLPLALAGAHQADNGAIAVALAREAGAGLGRPVGDRAVAEGLAAVRWPGRCERVGDDLLFDGAHNPDGARALAAALPALAAGRRVVLLVSIVDDKDPEAILAALAPVAAAIVTTRSDNARSRPAGALAAVAARFTGDAIACDDADAALGVARNCAGPGGLVVVCGSMFLVGMLRARALGEPVDPLPTSDPIAPRS